MWKPSEMACHWLLFISLEILIASSEGRTTSNHVYKNRDPEEEWLRKWNVISEMILKDGVFRDAVIRASDEYKKMERMIAEHDDPRGPPIDVPAIPFKCETNFGVSPEIPQTVHELRPGDIKVVAALGDSITAGNGVGAEEILGVALENRGESWSIGGDFRLEDNVTTIPNILRKFRSDVKGASTCISQETNFRYAWFNQARPGAKADDMPTGAERLINNMTNDKRIDFDKDWKLITLFVGGNDLCDYCTDPGYHSPDQYVSWIRQALDKLHAEVPRAFVNLVPMLDISEVHSVVFHANNTNYPGEPEWEDLYPWICRVCHRVFCPCIMNETDRVTLRKVQQDYFYGLKELIDSGRYDTRNDFTVVLQPHLKDQPLIVDPITNLTDNRYFAPDCFHPNRRAHQIFAFLLWNVMLTPVEAKQYVTSPGQYKEYVCPSEDQPYLFTHANSYTSSGVRLTFTWSVLMDVLLVTWILKNYEEFL